MSFKTTYWIPNFMLQIISFVWSDLFVYFCESLVSGVFSSKENVQSLVSLGVGVFARINVFSLTLQWSLCVIVVGIISGDGGKFAILKGVAPRLYFFHIIKGVHDNFVSCRCCQNWWSYTRHYRVYAPIFGSICGRAVGKCIEHFSWNSYHDSVCANCV